MNKKTKVTGSLDRAIWNIGANSKDRSMSMLAKFLVVALLWTVSSGCSQMKIEDFRGKNPNFQIEQYFDGTTEGWGMIHDRFGNLRSQFSVTTEGSSDGKTLRFSEHFSYADGRKETRTWTLQKKTSADEGRSAENPSQSIDHYVGSANDTLGQAEGESLGNAFTWRYRLELKRDGKTSKVSVTDWLYLQPDGVLLSRGVIRKFGVKLAEVVVVFKKNEDRREDRVVSEVE